MIPEKEPRQDIIEAASRWDARLRSPRCTETDRIAFREWEELSPEHAAAFENLQSTLALARLMADRPHIRALRDDALVRYRQAGTRRKALGWATAASLALVLGSTFLSKHSLRHDGDTSSPVITAMEPSASSPASTATVAVAPTGTPSPPARAYRTDANERTEVRLSDGSTVILNASTRMVTRFTPHRRDLEILGGQAFFRVSKDPSRPFVVKAGNREVVAVGTAFEVRLDRRTLDVTLLEGKVTIKPVGDSGGSEQIHLVPDQRMVITGNSAPVVNTVNSSLATGWAEGRLYFDDTPLDQAVKEMNRYSAVKVELRDKSLASYRVSGMFRIGGQISFVEALQAYFPIAAIRKAENLIVLTPSPRSRPAMEKNTDGIASLPRP